MRALVTGGAGLIGSHIADRLIREGWWVRILDNLEPQTHRNLKPAWIPRGADLNEADIRDPAADAVALRDIDVVFPQAAYRGGHAQIYKITAPDRVSHRPTERVIRATECR